AATEEGFNIAIKLVWEYARILGG
ncbi:MAG: hypothetical protein JWR80_5188, partial [Bradyrhizobium sp.]|nr:hypothetical protein [Bradyrhizobium sp.]